VFNFHFLPELYILAGIPIGFLPAANAGLYCDYLLSQRVCKLFLPACLQCRAMNRQVWRRFMTAGLWRFLICGVIDRRYKQFYSA
jgi:hypothetical protein